MALTTVVSVYIRTVDVVSGSGVYQINYSLPSPFRRDLYRNIIAILEKSMWYECKSHNLWW
jgi:hypothetical protein